jgi:hypothetical protein
MFRKFALALAATAALGTASLAVSTSPAEAKYKGFHKHHHHHGHHHHWRGHRFHGFYGPGLVSYAYGGCYVKRWVATPWGYKVRWVNRCF